MKKYLILTFFILFLNSNLISQTVNNDTSKTSKPYYFRLSPIGTSIDIGKYKEKLVQNKNHLKNFQ